MSGSYKPVFDTTDADSMAASANVGAYLRGGNDGGLVSQSNNSLHVHDGGNSLTVDAVDLDIRNLVFATDKVDASGSVVALDAGTLAALETITVLQGTSPWVVSATDLDIRDLSAASDSVAAWTNDGAGAPIGSTAGALNVFMTNAISVDIDGVYDGGTNTNPDNAGLIAHVRNAAPADAHQTFRSTGGAASSDAVVAANVFGLDVNAFGMVYNGTTWDRQDGYATGLARVADMANGAQQNTNKSVNATGVLLASELANRLFLNIANIGNKEVYLGKSGVLTTDGFPIYPGEKFWLRCGAGVVVHGVSATAQDLRIWEIAA